MTEPKTEFVKSLFSSISKNYDLANDLMTFGLARWWRRKLISWSEVQPGQKVLDCATGTGDLALSFQKKVSPKGSTIGVDFCQDMLDVAETKRPHSSKLPEFQWADITRLNFEDDHFDITSISYGIRNVENTIQGLKEMARVTRPNGFVMILETGDPSNSWIAPLLKLHFKLWVPLVGGLISGQKPAYEYLNQSSNRFPCGDDFVRLMESTDMFAKIEYKTLMGGASYLYKAQVKG